MKLIVLPGNSPSNKEWALQMSQHLLKLFPDQYVQSYSHWDGHGEILDIGIEAAKLADNCKDSESIIVAKSAGAMLAIYCISNNLIKPKKCIFMGLPVLWAEKYGFEMSKWIENFSVPTVLLQNSNDPITSYAQASDFIKKYSIPHIFKIIETAGDTHKYDNFVEVKKIITNFNDYI